MTDLTEQPYAVQTKSGDPEEGKRQIERASGFMERPPRAA